MLIHCGIKCEETETCTYKDGHGCEGCAWYGNCQYCNNTDCWVNKGYTDKNKVCEKFECNLETEPCEYTSCYTTCKYKDGYGCEGCAWYGNCQYCNNTDCWINKGYTDKNKVCERFECNLKTEPCEYVSCDNTCTQYGLCCSCGCEDCPKRQININKLNEKEKENGS